MVIKVIIRKINNAIVIVSHIYNELNLGKNV